MAASTIELHPEALSELKSTISWYVERSESAAVKFAEEIDQALQLIVEAPQRWPAGEHGTRRFVLRRFPFAIAYRDKDAHIQVLAVAHGHRHPSYWKHRL